MLNNLARGRSLVIGVPDSKMKGALEQINYTPAVDEGSAVAIAAGHYTATKEVPLVYMQSDGLCNALNAITSLVIPYQIPMDIFISVRNKPEQHAVMGSMVHKLVTMLEGQAQNYQTQLKFHIYE